MPTHYPRADKTSALNQIAKAINEIKAAFKGTDREAQITAMLPELRGLWQAAHNGDDAPVLIKLVCRLNAKSWLTNRQFDLTRNYSKTGWAFDVQVTHHN